MGLEILSKGTEPPNERGVTLVETLVALLILSLVAISILNIFSHGIQLNVSGADYAAINNTGKRKMEQLLALDFAHADLAPATAHTESVAKPPLLVTWRVGEHAINQTQTDPASAVGADPLTSSVTVGTGNIKVIAVTVASQSRIGVGQRDVTIQDLKIRY